MIPRDYIINRRRQMVTHHMDAQFYVTISAGAQLCR